MADEPAKVANPAPLGLAGFGLTTVVLSCINAGLLGKEALPAVIPLAFAFGGLAQIFAGFMEFRNGNTFGTVAFIAYGLFWWWFAFLQWTVGAGWMKAPSGSGLAVTLLMWGVFTFYMWISTFRLSLALWSVFLTLWIAYFLLACGEWGFGTVRPGGWVGLFCGLNAMYVSFAMVANETFGRTVLPLGSPVVKA